MRILITGSNGLLGQKITDLCMQKSISFLATSKGDNRYSKISDAEYRPMDIAIREEIESVVAEFKPTVIINTAAITNVDYCEDHKELCDLINVEAVRNLLHVAEKNNIHLIHLSTDFVFDGEKGPYKETDERNPLSYYGLSKVKSEDLLLNSAYKNWAIVRTIIVFGIAENMSRSNIVLWAKSALEEGQPMTIVDDQFRAPTFAEDLAWACVRIGELNARGIYHISGPDTFSIIELVQKVADYWGLDKSTLKTVSSSSLNQAAKRPPKTGFILDKARMDLGYDPGTFEESLDKLSSQLKKN
ncbi:MAG: SDR family oxidoreductase [Crocinitomicaceae bacterium]|nr:SDR family oxidoreductase [Crocinitomicaceae bacterium]